MSLGVVIFLACCLFSVCLSVFLSLIEGTKDKRLRVEQRGTSGQHLTGNREESGTARQGGPGAGTGGRLSQCRRNQSEKGQSHQKREGGEPGEEGASERGRRGGPGAQSLAARGEAEDGAGGHGQNREEREQRARAENPSWGVKRREERREQPPEPQKVLGVKHRDEHPERGAQGVGRGASEAGGRGISEVPTNTGGRVDDTGGGEGC